MKVYAERVDARYAKSIRSFGKMGNLEITKNFFGFHNWRGIYKLGIHKDKIFFTDKETIRRLTEDEINS